jgi:hypothetical protein
MNVSCSPILKSGICGGVNAMTTALNLERRENIWRFWLGWTAANAVGWAVGLTAMTVVQLALETASGGVLVEAEGGAVLESVGNLLFGLAVGAMQWSALRWRLVGARWWIPATAAGFFLAGLVGGALEDSGSAAGGFVVSFGLGATAGTLQWLILRRQVRRAGWWVLASTILVFAGLIAGLLVAMALTGEGPGVSVSGAAFAAVAGAVFGMTSGVVLLRLLRQPALIENSR